MWSKMTIEEYFKKHNLNQQDFEPEQLELIEDGLKDGLDVSLYANPKYESIKMYEILLALREEKQLKLNPTKKKTKN
ncbi:hypothetical protein ACJA25_02845 [Mycoplasmopsis hyopharyngis]|uniref:hypothetical protein n=1 Tax=Mycoplasmopsis hyopharyngis TaxID=29558 RepID=UPI0038736A3C